MLKRTFVLCALALGVGIIPSCGGDDDRAPTKLAEPCHANSDCGGDLVCALGKCHVLCSNSKDCPAGQRCVKTDTSAACQLPLESKCLFNSQCEYPLVCAIDGSCRNGCMADRDCLSGQFCDVSLTCVDRTEVPDGGGLPDLRDAGSGGSAGAAGAGGSAGAGGAAGAGGSAGAGGAAGAAGAGGSAGSGGSDGGMPDVSADMGTTDTGTDTSVDRSMDISTNPDSIAPDAGCGHTGEACCASGSPCVVQTTCDLNTNTCIACGQKDQACCGTGSACLVANLDCVSGICQCGAEGQVCCGGTTCTGGFTCSGGGDAGKPTCGCGGNGQACCANSMCSSASLGCAGTKCTCITAAFPARDSSDVNVLRSDGSVWYYAGYSSMPTLVANASMQPVTAFTKVSTTNQYSCGIKTDKTVWCWWNQDPGSTTAQYGQLGDGTTNASRYPVQVLTAAGGNPPLANVIDISTYTSTTCAATSDQTMYCWGYGYYGQLGTGTPAPTYSAYATQTLASVGVPFTGVDQVTVGAYHVCAHKADGTVWCWGYNSNGQVGNGMTATIYYPAQVMQLSNQANEVGAGSSHTCARSSDIVLCWGYNGSGIGDGTMTSPAPVTVKVAAGGADFTGASELKVSANGSCVLKAADKSIWCWGSYGGSSSTPAQASPAGFPISNVYYWGVMSGNLVFARNDAEMYMSGYKVTTPVACPP